jgi:hypothetical protein
MNLRHDPESLRAIRKAARAAFANYRDLLYDYRGGQWFAYVYETGERWDITIGSRQQILFTKSKHKELQNDET